MAQSRPGLSDGEGGVRASPLAIAAATALAAWLALAASPEAAQDEQARRANMVAVVEMLIEATSAATGVAALDPRVAGAMRKVPRDRFLPPVLRELAYADTPLPLGHGQNLAQPYLAALMTQMLDVKPGEKVFETGTDVGYHAAILSELGAEVYSVEIVGPLLDVARKVLPALGYGKVRLRQGDGYSGWPEHAPYDAILVKESSLEVPPALLRQLKEGGRMAIPLGPPEGPQFLTLIEKQANGRLRQKRYLPVRFTPFQGGERT
jgi:protein-L-isoaspartate(D-aspartate) O-methyltransferase